MKNILYLGTFVDEIRFNQIIKVDKNPQSATQLFSLKLFNALSSFDGFNYTIFTTNPISDFPLNPAIFNKKKFWKYNNHKIKELFFINLPILKTISIIVSLSIGVLSWLILTPAKKKKCVFIDNYQLPYLLIGFIISRLSNIPLIAVLTDPPNMVYKLNNEPFLKKKFRILNSIFSKFLLKKINGVISLTDYLAKEYCPLSKYIVIEAIGDGNKNQKKFTNDDNFIIMYSGGLSKQYGIELLVESFSEINLPKIELWFFGKGDALDLIMEYGKKDSRIKYKGYFDNLYIKRVQSEATILINPRPTNLPDEKYSFPSKVLEYIESGTPSLVTKLKGIPVEYYHFLFFIDPFTKEEIISKIKKLYFMDKKTLFEFGKSARIFSNQKNFKNQGQKIVNFIQSF